MSKYTTGEIAKLCGVSVRTVQYYDSRKILVPSELSEGGRRIYSEEDLQKMKTICFLREIGLSINSIGELLSEEDPGSVISLLLEQQKQMLRKEINERQIKLNMLEQIKRELKDIDNFSVESISDIAHIMENKKKLSKLRWVLITVGIIMDIIEIATAILWINSGIWWPFAVGMCIVVALGVWISMYYFKRVAYICPQCHAVFKPSFKEAFFAYHTPRTRKLTCPKCGHKGHCVETYGEEVGAK
ncbi:MAG: MerR family transcriptional regulator [Ruminococcus sp.]|nr:MerR family transcriptional regulator [Ruminococcus sp.]